MEQIRTRWITANRDWGEITDLFPSKSKIMVFLNSSATELVNSKKMHEEIINYSNK